MVRAVLVVSSIVATLLLLEAGLRIHRTQTSRAQPAPARLHIETDAPYLYTLNPELDDISSQGTRDDEVAIPKPQGVFRILVLGDSIAYEPNFSRNQAFPNLLEALLRKNHSAVEVVNSAVSGYTPYNELQYYLTTGRKFQPDLIIVAFCMNDVVNPRMHWGDTPFVKIPDAAIPNHDYDRNHILPTLQKLREHPPASKSAGPPILKEFELYKAIAPLLRRQGGGKQSWDQPIPTHITGEDTLSIEVLLNRESAEWQWLANIYDQLHAAVRADGARLLIVIFPLAYQLDEKYPHLPQKQFAEYCREKSIACLDLLPAFRQRSAEDVFMMDRPGFHDIWHLTEAGHELTATELLRFTTKEGLLLTPRPDR